MNHDALASRPLTPQVGSAMRIVCVHQGYELYGSDRSFIESVEAIRAAWPAADIEAIVPRDGPIVPPLRRIASRVTIEPIFVLRRRDLAKLISTGVFRLVPALWRAIRRFRTADLVYVNTVVVLDYLLAAGFFPRKTLIHVHEIPEGGTLKMFRLLLRWTGAELIFNSKATRAAYSFSDERRQHVVYNGVAVPPGGASVPYDGSRPLRLLMMGRINRTKGQDVLIAALASLPPDIVQRLEVRVVGNSFGDDVIRNRNLRESVRVADLESVVQFEPFHDDPAPLYQWTDVVVVPSRLPESLGRVAIEAMAYGRPPLVSAIGGLTEVVADGVTGWTVTPNDAGALASRIAEIVTEPKMWASFPAAARSRYETIFAHDAVTEQIQAIVRARLTADDGKRRPPSYAHV